MKQRLHAPWIFGISLCLHACARQAPEPEPTQDGSTGVLDPQSSQDDLESSTQAPPDASSPDTQSTPDSSADPCADAALEIGATSLRRLTPAQYENAVKQLLFPASLDFPALESAPPAFGFLNFGAQQVPSALVIAQFQQAALEVTTQALPELAQWTQCPPAQQDEACGVAFVTRFVTRAFRRPVPSAKLEPYLSFFRSKLAEHNFEVATALTVQAVLQAPEFLYLLEETRGTPDRGIEALDSYSIASRLSLLLWDSLPDQELLDAAQRNELEQADQVRAQARRMLQDPRAKASISRFFSQWLDTHKLDHKSPDPASYPDFSEQIRDLMHESLERRIEHAVFSGQGTLASLLLEQKAWVTPELAPIYGVQAPSDPGWQLVDLPATQRAGLLTDAAWLAARAHAVHPSPVQRGIFVLERMLCQPPYPPPADADTTPPKADPQSPSTNRERYLQHVLDPTCAGCHAPIDGIGMGFEHYDALGRWRDQDNGFSVDASGELMGSDRDGSFRGALELSNKLSASDDVHACVARQILRYSLGRETTTQDSCQLKSLRARFLDSQGNFLQYFEAITASEAFRYRKLDE